MHILQAKHLVLIFSVLSLVLSVPLEVNTFWDCFTEQLLK